MSVTHIRIRPYTFPSLFNVLTELSLAMGAVNYQEPARTYFDIPIKYIEYLENLDAELEHLTNEDIQVFVDGEEKEVETIANRNPTLQVAHDLLNDMFDGKGSL